LFGHKAEKVKCFLGEITSVVLSAKYPN